MQLSAVGGEGSVSVRWVLVLIPPILEQLIARRVLMQHRIAARVLRQIGIARPASAQSGLARPALLQHRLARAALLILVHSGLHGRQRHVGDRITACLVL